MAHYAVRASLCVGVVAPTTAVAEWAQQSEERWDFLEAAGENSVEVGHMDYKIFPVGRGWGEDDDAEFRSLLHARSPSDFRGCLQRLAGRRILIGLELTEHVVFVNPTAWPDMRRYGEDVQEGVGAADFAGSFTQMVLDVQRRLGELGEITVSSVVHHTDA